MLDVSQGEGGGGCTPWTLAPLKNIVDRLCRFSPPILFESGSILVVRTSFRSMGMRYFFRVYLAMFPLETRYIYIWFVGVNCFLSFSIKWIEIEEEQELIVSLVLINFWKRS